MAELNRQLWFLPEYCGSLRTEGSFFAPPVEREETHPVLPVSHRAKPQCFTTQIGKAHWHILNRARAIENGAFVVAACAVGSVIGGGEAPGHSLIVDPWGEVIGDVCAGRGVVDATINLAEVASARGKIPALRHDRPFTQLLRQMETII